MLWLCSSTPGSSVDVATRCHARGWGAATRALQLPWVPSQPSSAGMACFALNSAGLFHSYLAVRNDSRLLQILWQMVVRWNIGCAVGFSKWPRCSAGGIGRARGTFSSTFCTSSFSQQGVCLHLQEAESKKKTTSCFLLLALVFQGSSVTHPISLECCAKLSGEVTGRCHGDLNTSCPSDRF